jgi:hypothetical protein
LRGDHFIFERGLLAREKLKKRNLIFLLMTNFKIYQNNIEGGACKHLIKENGGNI